jgi:hypothetical protein
VTEDVSNLRPAPPSAMALAAARAAVLAEAEKPRQSWRRRAGLVVLSSLGPAALVGAVALAGGAASAGVIAARWLTMALLGIVGPLLAWSAARPRSPWLRRGAWTMAAVTGVALVLTRPAQALEVSSSPEWVCTLSHLAVATPAALVALLFLLPSMAFNPGRSVSAGLSVGTTGALLGELLCGHNAEHIAVFHLAAWALAALAVLAVSSQVRPRSYAP